jgi:hypothetical protein
MNNEQSYVVRRIYIVNNNCLVLIHLNYSTAFNVNFTKKSNSDFYTNLPRFTSYNYLRNQREKTPIIF